MKLKDARIKAGLTQQAMSDKFEIPKRTIENWEAETRKCPVYVEKLLLEKLEGIIMMNAKEVLKRAIEINEATGFHKSLPDLEVGDIVKLSDVWDGNGEEPTESYSYLLTHDGDEWGSTGDIYINYVFEFLDNSIVDLINNLDAYSENHDEDMSKIVDAEVKITNIDFC
ncbi:MAG: hypothetical protein K0S04_322 [Herbinix sp.]|jgi:DNA-binding XRE family transcriptional regulator|nr:hypothetical protein [Herbinix sp.]